MQTMGSNQRYLHGYDFPDNVRAEADLQTIVNKHKIYLLATPSHAFSAMLKKLQAAGLAANAKIIWATKGLGISSSGGAPVLLSDIVRRELGEDTHYAVVSGPSFSKEVASNLPTAVTTAGNNLESARFAAELFHGDGMRVYINDDIVGVQLGGAIKNVIAIAAGISDGLGFGANSRSAIITRGLAEMARLGKAMGANKETFLGLAGIGDLVLTCTDDQSRNRRFGLGLGQGHSAEEVLGNIGQEVEGFLTTREVFKLAQHHCVEMPIVEQVHDILFRGVSAIEAVQTLLQREPIKE